MRQKIITFLLLAIFYATNTVQSAILHELLNPKIILTNGENIFIAEEATIFIYSVKDFIFLKKFGSKGEGPQQFKYISLLTINDNQLIVNSNGKVSYYSIAGDFIKENNVPIGNDFIPCKKSFIAWNMIRDGKDAYITVNLFNEFFKKQYEITRRKGNFLGGRFKDPLLSFAPLGPEFALMNNGILAKNEQGGLCILDMKGKLLQDITVDLEKISITNKNKEEILNVYKTNPITKPQFDKLSQRFKFSSHFPLVKNFFIDTNKIYMQSFNKKNDLTELIIFSNNGKYLGKSIVKIAEANILEPYPYTIYKNNIFLLKENDEQWELEIFAIPAPTQ